MRRWAGRAVGLGGGRSGGRSGRRLGRRPGQGESARACVCRAEYATRLEMSGLYWCVGGLRVVGGDLNKSVRRALEHTLRFLTRASMFLSSEGLVCHYRVRCFSVLNGYILAI